MQLVKLQPLSKREWDGFLVATGNDTRSSICETHLAIAAAVVGGMEMDTDDSTETDDAASIPQLLETTLDTSNS